MLSIFLLSRKCPGSHELEMFGCVVAAKDADAAREMAARSSLREGEVEWLSPLRSDCRWVGQATQLNSPEVLLRHCE